MNSVVIILYGFSLYRVSHKVSHDIHVFSFTNCAFLYIMDLIQNLNFSIGGVYSLKKSTKIILCLLALVCVVGFCCYESLHEFILTQRPEKIDADAVVMHHSDVDGTSSEEILITDEDIVAELVSLHNSLKVLYMSRPLAATRTCITFYEEEEVVAEWCISVHEDDGMLITCSDALDGGNYFVKGEFDYNRLTEIFNSFPNQ